MFVANTVDTFGAATGSIFGANPAETGGRLVWGFGTSWVSFGGTSAPAFAPLSSFKLHAGHTLIGKTLKGGKFDKCACDLRSRRTSLDSMSWGWSCMLQLQEADNWEKPAATTWAAEFLLRDGESREFLGPWINSNSVHDAKKRLAKQVITCSFPCVKWMHMIGARASPRCQLCKRERNMD